MSRITHTSTLFVIALVTTAFCASSAMAADAAPGAGQQNHPRRAEVNHRLAKQNARIKNDVKDGDMSKAKAQRLHAADKGIHQEEHDMAKQDGGHITQSEQKTLNQQENAVSHRINQ